MNVSVAVGVPVSPVPTESFFRSPAWVQAWLDVYGKDPRISLIDTGGAGNPLDYFYRLRSPLTRWFSVSTLALVGTAVAPLSAPRSEYNYPNRQTEPADLLARLKDESWSQIILRDLTIEAAKDIEWAAFNLGWRVHRRPSEPTYYIAAANPAAYKASLSQSTRSRYFLRRQRLAAAGEIEFVHYPRRKAEDFFDLLDGFHRVRWGQICYSPESRQFLENFMARLEDADGKVVMQAMQINGRVVSVIFDIVYQDRRYNLQSGFDPSFMRGVAPGALHMGYAIEAAISAGQEYDLLAGHGKNHNYKVAIANRQSSIQTLIIQKPYVAMLRRLKHLRSVRRLHQPL